VQERAIRTVDQARELIQLEIPHVSRAQIERDTCLGSRRAGLLEHRRRRVDADDGPARSASDGYRDSAVADSELHEWPVGFRSESDVKRNICRHPG